jgi:hypothetical protein
VDDADTIYISKEVEAIATALDPDVVKDETL